MFGSKTNFDCIYIRLPQGLCENMTLFNGLAFPYTFSFTKFLIKAVGIFEDYLDGITFIENVIRD